MTGASWLCEFCHCVLFDLISLLRAHLNFSYLRYQRAWMVDWSPQDSKSGHQSQLLARTRITNHLPMLPRKQESPLHGLLASQISCLSCGHQSPVKYDSFDCLTLTMPQCSFMVGLQLYMWFQYIFKFSFCFCIDYVALFIWFWQDTSGVEYCSVNLIIIFVIVIILLWWWCYYWCCHHHCCWKDQLLLRHKWMFHRVLARKRLSNNENYKHFLRICCTHRCVKLLSQRSSHTFFCLLACTKHTVHCTWWGQYTMMKRSINYVNIMTSNQGYLSGFAGQINRSFGCLEIDQTKETCCQPGRSPSFKL